MAHHQTSASTIDWLLAGDPAIRWQVRSDLMGSSPSAVERDQRRVATEGWGARLLALQDQDGTWAGSMYSPKWISAPRLALPRIRPRICFLYFTRFGINMITTFYIGQQQITR